MTRVSLWIDGMDVDGADGTLDVLNPATGGKIATLTQASADQVNDAVAAAKGSFEAGVWSGASLTERRAFMRRAAAAIRDNVDILAELQIEEGGMIPVHVKGQIYGAASWFDYFADFLTTEQGESYRQFGTATTLINREPIGVCGLFSPWNVPVTLSAIKLAPALAAGNSVVLKPSEITPVVTRKLTDLVNGAGLPKGVLNYINGNGAIAGAALAGHPDVDMLSFTGGHVGGTAVGVAAARKHAPCVMELGGKSATVVFEDADFEAALAGASEMIYGTNGEACLAGSRILVQESVADEFLKRFQERAEEMVIGNPVNEGVEIGPMISEAHRNLVLGFYDSAHADGDTVLFGGTSDIPEGYYVKPGAIQVASGRSRVWREEVFGPLAAVTTFKDEAHAITLANDSDFGLSGYLWTRDIGRALRVSRRLRTGTVLINSGFMRELNAPFGGFRGSGVGREGGYHSWMNVTEAKTTIINHG